MGDVGDFEVLLSSDPNYEELIAEISYKSDLCVLISREDGFDKLRLEVHPRRKGGPWRFDLAEFGRAVAHAKEMLRKPDDP